MEAGKSERRTHTHIRALLANTGEGLLIVDRSGAIKVMNETAERLLAVARGEVIGEQIEKIGVAVVADLVRRTIKSSRARKPVRASLADRILTCRAIAFSDDKHQGCAVVLRDDTELLSQQERAEAILAGAGDGLIVFDPDSRVTYANPAAVEILGRDLKRSVNKHVSLNELLGEDPPDVEGVEPCWQIKSCMRADCPAHGATDLRCWLRCGTPGPDGTPLRYSDKRLECARCEVYIENSAHLGEFGAGDIREVTISDPEHRVLEIRTNPVVSRGGKYLGCVTSLHDVTAEREIAVMKNEFVSMVSHELRTPLTSIKGYVDLIVDGEAGDINDVQLEFLQIVQENSDRLVALINDLLDISRIESGRVHLKIEPIEMDGIVEGVVETFRTVADQAGVDLSSHISRGLPRAKGDRDRIGQVLMNLVSNAIKYSPGGGSTRVEAKRRGDNILIEVADTGIGIDPSDQEHLFTKFFRVDSSLTREIGGTGLGLSICKSVVELLGGEIGVRSRPGQGSTFFFTLPIASADLVRTPPIEGPLGAAGGTVLVVDRDPEVAELIATYLEKRGYKVVQANSAGEALEQVARHEPSAITLDVMLDDMDGFELLQMLKDDPRSSEVPIVVLSIVCDEGRSMRLGAADYLEKPIDSSRLTKVIDDLVGAKSSPVVLVADDDRAIVGVLAETLKAKGFAVAAAYDGKETLQAIEANRPDLILLDLIMPVMDGYQVIQQIKSRDDTKDIPIVVMTAHHIDDDQIDILQLASEQLAKPLAADTVAEKVERVLGKWGE